MNAGYGNYLRLYSLSIPQNINIQINKQIKKKKLRKREGERGGSGRDRDKRRQAREGGGWWVGENSKKGGSENPIQMNEHQAEAVGGGEGANLMAI